MSAAKWRPFFLALNVLKSQIFPFSWYRQVPLQHGLIYQDITHDTAIKVAESESDTVETLYSTIYYSKYFIELNFDKSTQYVALWTHKRQPIPRPFGRAMECLLWVLQQKLTVL